MNHGLVLDVMGNSHLLRLPISVLMPTSTATKWPMAAPADIAHLA